MFDIYDTWSKNTKGVSPVIAVILLIALVIVAVGIIVVFLSKVDMPTPAPTAILQVKAIALRRGGLQLNFSHMGGDALTMSDLRQFLSCYTVGNPLKPYHEYTVDVPPDSQIRNPTDGSSSIQKVEVKLITSNSLGVGDIGTILWEGSPYWLPTQDDIGNLVEVNLIHKPSSMIITEVKPIIEEQRWDSILVYDDFNDEVLGTNLGGDMGGMQPYEWEPYAPTLSFTSSAKEGNYALSIAYNFPWNQWCGVWSFFLADNDPYDISNYSDIRMWVKGAAGGEKFKVEIEDNSGKQLGIYVTQFPGFEGGFTTDWQELVIPLYYFDEVIDLTEAQKVNIVFDIAPRSGTVYVDYIRFTDLSWMPLPSFMREMENWETETELVLDDFDERSGVPLPPAGYPASGFSGPDNIYSGYLGPADAHEGQGALSLSYSGSTGWIARFEVFDSISVENYNNFKIWLKRASGAEEIKIELKGDTGTNVYFINPSLNWQEFSISKPAGMTSLNEVVIVFEPWKPGVSDSGTLYVDLMRFTT